MGSIDTAVNQFFERYPCSVRVKNLFKASTAEAQATVLNKFKPLTQGNTDYSKDLVMFITDIRRCTMEFTQNGSGHKNLCCQEPAQLNATTKVSLSAAPPNKVMSEPVSALDSELKMFRSRFRIDDRAFGLLAAAPQKVQQTVLKDFRPKRTDGDFSKLVSAYVISLCKRNEEGEVIIKSNSTIEITDKDVQKFFCRYPCNSDARDFFKSCPSRVQTQVVQEFRPHIENDTDHSTALVACIALIKRRMGEDCSQCQNLEPPLAAIPPHTTRGLTSIQPIVAAPRSAKRPCEEKDVETCSSHDLEPESADTSSTIASSLDMELHAFRSKYPMDDRAFQYVMTAPRELQEALLKTFTPRRTFTGNDFSTMVSTSMKKLRNELDEAKVRAYLRKKG